MERRLAAILAADVVGYSRLVEVNEARTLSTLQMHNESVIGPKITHFHGRIVKQMGDGLLAEFRSAVEAVQCAIAVQKSMMELNERVPEQQQIIFRIGINVGDVVVEAGDIYGDGVNVAARLESLADPGGVCVSDAIITHIKGKVDRKFENLGEHNLKNISEPVTVWRWSTETEASAPKCSADLSPEAVTGPIIAVLPFHSLNQDAEIERFADGLTDEVIMAFARQTGMSVLARSSTTAFKGKVVDAKGIGRRLGAHYLLEGSVRSSGSRIRVIVNLMETASGTHLWGEHYNGDLADEFSLQDEVTFGIVAAAWTQIHVKDARRARKIPEDRLTDSELLSIASQRMQALSAADYREAARLTALVVDRSPQNAMALAMSASCTLLLNEIDYRKIPERDAARAIEMIERSITLNEESDYAHYVHGRLLLHFRYRQDLAIAEAERAIELNPNYTYAHALLGFALTCSGDPERGMPLIERAIRADPRRAGNVSFIEYLALGHFSIARYELAIERSESAAQRAGYQLATRFFLASCLAHLGRVDEGRAQLDTALDAAPNVTFSELRRMPFKDPDVDMRFKAGLRRVGMSE